jgi:hypothetical protein
MLRDGSIRVVRKERLRNTFETGVGESRRMEANSVAFTIRRADEADLQAINRIYNLEIEQGTATWDLEPWTIEQRRTWFAGHDELTPVLIAEQDGSRGTMS